MKLKKSLIIFGITATILTNTFISFGANFKDMKNAKGADHWSLQFVTDMVNKGMINGYSDGTFKPNKAVTRLESIIFVSRFFQAKDINDVYTSNKSKWKEALDINAIPEFARPAVVFGLENKWYTQAYLKEFMNATTKTQKEAKRYEFAVYLVRALGWDKEMSNAAVVNYKDANQIPKQAVPYIEILGKKGVIVSTGEFNPQKSITRGEVAKVLSLSHSIKTKATIDSTQKQTEQKVIMPSGNVVEGQIKQLTLDTNNLILTLTDKLGNTNIFTNRTSGIILSKDGKIVLPQNLREGQSVKLYTDGTTVKGIEIIEEKVQSIINKKVSGEIYSINASSGKLKIKEGNIIEEYNISKNISITKNNKNSSIYDIISGDIADAEIKNSEVTSIVAKSVKKTLKNVTIKAITSYANGTATITIIDAQGNTHQMEYTQDSVAYQNNRIVTLSALSVGYEADVYANSNEILDMTIFGRSQGTLIVGVINYVDLRNDSIYIETKNEKDLRVIMGKDIEIISQLTNKEMSIYDLEKGQNVIINGYEGNGVFEATRISYY